MSTKPDIKKLLSDAKKHSKQHSGLREVALALAATTKLSAIDAGKLFHLPFSSPRIGLKDKAGMHAFKKSLADLMPRSSSAIGSKSSIPRLSVSFQVSSPFL